MAGPSEQALNVAATLTQCALDTANDLNRQLSALRRVSALFRDRDVAGGVVDADLLTLMEVALGLLDRRGESLAAHLQRQAIEAYRRARPDRGRS